MAQFLNEHCGTFRTPFGLLSEKAGKVLTLDHLAHNFFTADIPSRPEIVQSARLALRDVTGHANASASYYVKAMERIVEKGEAWLTKEQAR
jgi:protein disulfide-isomerase A6